MSLTIEIDREDDGRWIAEVIELPGVQGYGQSRDQAVVQVQVLTLRVLADRLDHGETVPELGNFFSIVAPQEISDEISQQDMRTH